jgi:hypothetical protein
VTGTVSPEGTDCYAFKPVAGTDLSIEVAAGPNIIFSISDLVDAVDSYRLRASGYGHTMAVGQLMRSVTDEPYRLVFSSSRPGAAASGPADASDAASADAPTVASVQARLRDLGYDPGQVDGVYGRRTEQAIREFLREQGLGRAAGIDAELVRMLDAAQRR